MQALPPGYTRFTVGGRTVAVQADYEEALRTLMILPFAQLAGMPEARRIAAGRAGPVTVPIPHSPDRVLVRPYAHGGLAARLGGRIFRDPRRAWEELAVSQQARHLELPIAPLLGISVTQREDGRHEMEAWSRWLPNAANLTGCLPAMAGEATARHALLDAVASSLRVCQEAGLVHRDLNARNIIAERQPGAWRALVIDLDRATIQPPLGMAERQSQVRRLYRSLVKEGMLPHAISDPEFETLARQALGEALPDNAWPGFIASCRRAAFWHGLLWKLQRLRRRLRA